MYILLYTSTIACNRLCYYIGYLGVAIEYNLLKIIRDSKVTNVSTRRESCSLANITPKPRKSQYKIIVLLFQIIQYCT